MYTWKDIKVITLQKMFAAEGSVIPNDESVKDYIAGMPGAANEALPPQPKTAITRPRQKPRTAFKIFSRLSGVWE